MFSGVMAFILFVLGGSIAFSYKNPAAYKLLLEKLFNWLGFMAFGALCMCMGMDSVIRQLNLDYQGLGIYSHLIPDFRYLWAIPLSFFTVYYSLSALGRLTSELKSVKE
jgi:hypothetical protein